MDKHRRRFSWSGKKNKNAIIWLNGQKCIGPKEKEVLELKPSGNRIPYFLCKWWWKLEKHDGSWQKKL
jgi:hypothetical protein